MTNPSAQTMLELARSLRARRIMRDGGNGNVYDIADEECEQAAEIIERAASAPAAVRLPLFMEVARSRWNFEDHEFDIIEKVLSDPKCLSALLATPEAFTAAGVACTLGYIHHADMASIKDGSRGDYFDLMVSRTAHPERGFDQALYAAPPAAQTGVSAAASPSPQVIATPSGE